MHIFCLQIKPFHDHVNCLYEEKTLTLTEKANTFFVLS